METTINKSVEILIAGQKYLINIQGDLNVILKPIDVVPVPDPDKPEERDHPDERQPEMGEIKKGSKWSENPGKAETWKIVNMTNPPDTFKIIAEDGLNVIANLKTKEQAEALVNWFKTRPLPNDEDGEAGEENGEPQSVGGTGSFQPGTVF